MDELLSGEAQKATSQIEQAASIKDDLMKHAHIMEQLEAHQAKSIAMNLRAQEIVRRSMRRSGKIKSPVEIHLAVCRVFSILHELDMRKRYGVNP